MKYPLDKDLKKYFNKQAKQSMEIVLEAILYKPHLNFKEALKKAKTITGVEPNIDKTL